MHTHNALMRIRIKINTIQAHRSGVAMVIFFAALLLLVVLTACSPAQELQPSPTPAIKPTLSPAVVATFTPTPIHAPDHSIGPSSAYLTIVMYGDYQSGPSLDIARSIAILRETYLADVRLVWRNFPQTDNDKALLAAQAAEASGDQGKFWEMHDQILVHQADWRSLTVAQFHDKLADYAKLIGLDVPKFYAAIDGGAALNNLHQAISDAQALGLKGAPVLLFNGQAYSGRIDLYTLDNYTRLRLLEKRWFAAQPELQIDLSKQYMATLITEKGTVQIALDAKAAPVTVNNFVFLARAGWYNNITFHLVLPGSLVQTGDPSGSGLGIAGYTIVDEHSNGLHFDKPGRVAMASQRGAPNSGSSQFFITLAQLQPEGDYDGQFTIFGQATSGLDVLSHLTARNPSDAQNYPNPPPGDKLISVTIQEK
jgi:cyclophilin family peptidyl-prolyl cis-trans isomerase/protein-disulfide isomerase